MSHAWRGGTARRRGGGSRGPGGVGAAAAQVGPAAARRRRWAACGPPLVVRVLGVWCLVCVYWHVDSVLLF